MPVFIHCNSGKHRAPTLCLALGISDPWLPYCLCLCMFCKRLELLGLMFFSSFCFRSLRKRPSNFVVRLSNLWQNPRNRSFLFADTLKTSFSLTLPQSEVPVIGEGGWRRRVRLVIREDKLVVKKGSCAFSCFRLLCWLQFVCQEFLLYECCYCK